MKDDILVEESGSLLYIFLLHNNAPVAHLDRVADYESVGSRFESCQAHQSFQALNPFRVRCFFFVFNYHPNENRRNFAGSGRIKKRSARFFGDSDFIETVF